MDEKQVDYAAESYYQSEKQKIDDNFIANLKRAKRIFDTFTPEQYEMFVEALKRETDIKTRLIIALIHSVWIYDRNSPLLNTLFKLNATLTEQQVLDEVCAWNELHKNGE